MKRLLLFGVVLLLSVAAAVAVSSRLFSPDAPTITVVAPAKFERRPAGSTFPTLFYIYLRIEDGTRVHDVLWGTESDGRLSTEFPIELVPGKEYDFVVAQEAPSSADDGVDRFQRSHIVRIAEPYRSDFGPTLYDREVCEVHRRKMRRKWVRISYGLLGTLYTGGELKTQFPHHGTYYPGGCLRSDDSPSRELLFVCSECRQAHAAFNKAHYHRAFTTE